MPRPAAVLVAAGLAATVLAGCNKPAPKITVLGGGKVVTISPSTYCFDAAHCRHSTGVDLPSFTTAADEKVLIDVPKEVERRGWVVSALTLNGKTQLATSGPIRNSHTYRVPSGVNSGDPFIVQVNELHSSSSNGSVWSFLVQVSPTKS
jgi:hypothetical protein